MNPAPRRAADGGRRDDRPSGCVGNRIGSPAAEPAVDAEADRVREKLEDEVRVQLQRAEMDEDREGHIPSS